MLKKYLPIALILLYGCEQSPIVEEKEVIRREVIVLNPENVGKCFKIVNCEDCSILRAKGLGKDGYLIDYLAKKRVFNSNKSVWVVSDSDDVTELENTTPAPCPNN